MPHDNESNSLISDLIRGAFQLEFKTSGGKYNLFFTVVIIVLGSIFAIGNAVVEAVYIVVTKHVYPYLSFSDVMIPLAICGGLCFLYMILLEDQIIKYKKKAIKLTKHNGKFTR